MTEKSPEIVVGETLREQGLSVGLAESSTGGLIGHRITEVPGSSDYFAGAIVAYAARIKEELLGVARETLDKDGAVSMRAAREMARGARRQLGTDIGLAETGIAGPDGRRSQKPTGLSYIALTADDLEVCERHVFGRDRSGNKWHSADAALDLLRRYLDRRSEVPTLQQIVATLDVEGPPVLAVVQPATEGVTHLGKGQRLGVLSSAFNPITVAHVQLVELAMQGYQLAEVMMELPRSNVDKGVFGASLAERLWMLKRFVRRRSQFSVALCSHGRFIDKAVAIEAVYPEGAEIYFIIGYDTLVRVFDPKYYADRETELEELFQESQFIVANRDEHTVADVKTFLKRPMCRPFADRVHLIELDEFHASLSSTQVRERLKGGESVTGLVPEEVEHLLPLTGLASDPR